MFKYILRKIAVFIARPISNIGINIPERIFKHLHFVGPFNVMMPNGTKLKLYSWGHIVENQLAWNGWSGHESLERLLWLQIVKSAGDVFDIGANTGTFAFMAKATQPNACVYAFEPITRIANFISKNVEISNLNIEVIRAAVADESGTLPIFDPGGANAYSASLEENFLPGKKQSYDVPVITIDDFCTKRSCDPIAIKIDVEGAEGRVLLGARQVLRRRKAIILCEWLGNSKTHEAASNFLKEIQYCAVNIRDLKHFDLSSIKGYADRNIIIGPQEILAEAVANWTELNLP